MPITPLTLDAVGAVLVGAGSIEYLLDSDPVFRVNTNRPTRNLAARDELIQTTLNLTIAELNSAAGSLPSLTDRLAVSMAADGTITELNSAAGSLPSLTDRLAVSMAADGTILVPGADTQVFFNDAGVFAADAGLTYNKTTDTLTAASYNFTTDVQFNGAIVLSTVSATNKLKLGLGAEYGSNAGLDAQRSTVIGDEAGNATFTGYDNALVGYSAGRNLTTGARNIVMGAYAVGGSGNLISAPFDSVFIGYASGSDVLTAINSVFVGAYSGAFGDLTGSDNVGIGFESGSVLNTGGSNCLIGAYSGKLLQSGSGNVLIGNNAGDSLTTESNQFRVRNGTYDILSGTFNSFLSTPVPFGVGVAEPTNIIDVRLDQNTHTSVQVLNATVGTAAYTRFVAHGGGSNGAVSLEKYSTAYTSVGPRRASFGGLFDSGNAGLNLAAAGASGVMGFYTGGSADSNLRVFIDASGNVGLGTAAPTSPLHVIGAGLFTGAISASTPPTTGDHLCNRTYVDAAISGAGTVISGQAVGSPSASLVDNVTNVGIGSTAYNAMIIGACTADGEVICTFSANRALGATAWSVALQNSYLTANVGNGDSSTATVDSNTLTLARVGDDDVSITWSGSNVNRNVCWTAHAWK